ncbi:hypothetical protein E3J62_09580 [candidate division TA06 bacterium]|uniref:Uncharacterized protein n=1 Tax=candidate division TA06 bacterium TaxID=2250710 RepID=A0A523UQL3_UNCT6|nr:MAG: hypothetical protein E3J62_09580 [candidate division TA06 bacterium]
MFERQTIEQSVEQAFSGASVRDYAKEYLVAVRGNVQRLTVGFQYRLALVYFLFLIFWLLTNAAIRGVTLGPFELRDISIVERLIPVLIAYCYYEAMALVSMRNFQTIVHDSVVRSVYEPIYTNALSGFLVSLTAMDAWSYFAFKTTGVAKKLIHLWTAVLPIAVIFIPLAFECYAFSRCFAVFGFSDLLLWIALIVSVYFLTLGTVFWHQGRVVQ